MHSYIIYNKLASLYVCFAMLHITLHNETEIINAMLQNIEQPNGWNFTKGNSFRDEVNNFQIYRNNEEKEVKIFDMILPQRDEEILLWQKAGNYVAIPYTLEPSLSAAQRRAIPDVLRSIEVGTCIRFTAQPGPCDRGGASGGGAKLCFRSGPERAAHLGRRPGGPQAVTLAPEDGPYWVLHLVGHVLGLPHPHTCLRPQQDAQNTTRKGCRSRQCPWRQFDPGSALHLTPEELGLWAPPHTTRLSSASALLALWRTRRAARPSHWDLLALHELYRCWEGRPRCPPRPCRHGGFADLRCRCICPPGFSGDDCSVGIGPAQDCVRYVEVEEDLNLSPIGLPAQGAAGPADQCVVRVRTSSQRLRVLVRVTGESRMPPKQSVMLFADALLCSVKMYVFYNGSQERIFCILDYLAEPLLLNVAGTFADVVFHANPSQLNIHQTWKQARVVVRSADTLSKNLSENVTSTPTTTLPTVTSSLGPQHYGKGQMRSAVGAVPSMNLLILPPILFALMGFNFLVVFVIKKYWEYRYGTAGIYRGTERADWMDQDEEEPEDYQIKVEYSNSFDAIKPGWEGMTRETSVPQAEMTDLELFRTMYGVPARPQPDDTEQEPTPPARAQVPAEGEGPTERDRAGSPTPGKQESLTVPAEASTGVSGKKSLTNTGKPDISKSNDKRPASVDKVKTASSVHANLGQTTDIEASHSLEGKMSDGYLKPLDPLSKTRKRVSFSDDIGEPLSVHADLPTEKKGEKPQTSTASKKPSEPKVATDVCIAVPFSGDAQPQSTTANDSDSDDDSDESSCCDTSSSSSYHEDDDDLKKPEPGLLQGLTRCFQRKTNNDSSEIQ
ncbi:uncharacterized protein LOC122376640 [Amphibalanus amphitrite]|uniref:uncharacterized protein LOC122376640 n=1 Tax=Amphibalanus amphitrite TaxID=1232801 RepID=UPI001C8FBEDC|nr:uncharacterized protein LOC122376640 [Amphibalanus amphitrite]